MLESSLMPFIILMRQNLRARIISFSRSEPIYIEGKLHEPRTHGLTSDFKVVVINFHMIVC